MTIQAATAVRPRRESLDHVPYVLVVDDEPDVRLMLRMALRIAGFDVDEAPTGETALISLSQTAYDAVVLDIHLPDISGWDVFERIRHSPTRRTTPVVIVTADVSQGDPCDVGAIDGYSALMHKPMDPDDLVAQLERALETN